MSGLAVLFHRDGRPIDQAPVWAMLAAVPYRGPDGMRIGLFDTVALGHAKLAVTPEEEHERQPLVSTRTGCAIVADTRLDNREDLLARLPAPPTDSDAGLILRAYEAWGLDAAVHLLGDFAFAVWDPRHQRLVCARDTSGQRALFYRVDARTFAAASEIHQLLQDPSMPVAPNEERIRDFLVPLHISRVEKDHPATFYQGIHALPAGHVLVVDRGEARARRYWELRPPEELRYRTAAEYADHYRALFFDVVRSRLRSSRPMGILLSGGLDSSAVACVAHELYGAGQAIDRGFVGFSVVFDALECDERDLVRDIQAKYGFETQYIPYPAAAGWLQPEPYGFQESPNAGVRALRDSLFGAATRAGVRALLTGDVADSCVGGSPLVFDSLLRRGHLRAFWRRLHAYRRSSDGSLRKTVVLHCLAPLLPRALHRGIASAYLRRAVERNRRNLLPFWMPDSLRADLTQRHLEQLLAAERARRFSSPAREMEYRLLYPPEVARAPAPWPLELWRPFADRRLHEFLLAIPPEQKFEPHPDTDSFYAGSKQLVRRALRGVLPERIRTRTSKTHFGVVFAHAAERQWPLYEAAFGPGARPEVAAHGLVDRERFWARLKLLREGVEGADLMYLIQITSLETWLRGLRLPRPQSVTVAMSRGEPVPSAGPMRERAVLSGGA